MSKHIDVEVRGVFPLPSSGAVILTRHNKNEITVEVAGGVHRVGLLDLKELYRFIEDFTLECEAQSEAGK